MPHQTPRTPAAARKVAVAKIAVKSATLLLLASLSLPALAVEWQPPFPDTTPMGARNHAKSRRASGTANQRHSKAVAGARSTKRVACSTRARSQGQAAASARRDKPSSVKQASALEEIDGQLTEIPENVLQEEYSDHNECCDSAEHSHGIDCGVSGCESCGSCGYPSGPFSAYNVSGFWVRPEYLVWWVEGFTVPALVTSSPAGTDRDDAGVLGEPNTTILAGDDHLGGEARSGGRISFGYWFDPCKTSGIEVNYMGLGRNASRFRFESGGSPSLARPFFNVERGSEGQDSELIAFANLYEGNIQVMGDTTLQGIEVLWRRAVADECNYRIDLLAGWRFNRLDDDLLIRDFRTVLSGETGLAVGTTIEEFDRFKTRNRFNGAELGFVAQTRRCRWSLEVLMKLALGSTHSTVTIDGSTTTTVPVAGGAPDVAVTSSGLLAQGTNIGIRETTEFSVVPELGIMLGYDLTCRLRATFGYSFIYWSRVARPGDQIDLDLNLSQLDAGGLVGIPRPRFAWVGNDTWAQGLNFGLDYRF